MISIRRLMSDRGMKPVMQSVPRRFQVSQAITSRLCKSCQVKLRIWHGMKTRKVAQTATGTQGRSKWKEEEPRKSNGKTRVISK
jgi:hypothetical protein